MASVHYYRRRPRFLYAGDGERVQIQANIPHMQLNYS